MVSRPKKSLDEYREALEKHGWFRGPVDDLIKPKAKGKRKNILRRGKKS